MATYQPYNEHSSITGGGFEHSDNRSNTNDSTNNTSRPNTLTPVTIKQILNSVQEIQDGPFVTNGQELHYVSFVGVIRNITDHATNIFITIEDGTGQIDVKKWSDDATDMTASQENSDQQEKEYNSQVAQQYQVGTYVTVYGALKEFGGKKNIQYAVIKNVDSFNEIIAHHLEVIKWYAIATGKLPDPSHNQEQYNNNGNSEGQSLFVQENEATDNSNGSPLQRILEFCKTQCEGKDANSFAIPIPLIAQSLNLNEDTVRTCCSTLTEQGFIYPTFDDDNFFAL
ncbi:hypothetical protein KAFR_0C01760 [Kazachstania africana CBS 2517]|uniref:Replication protein A C-terminal domain-containing protein n=1 Tax=Kazachstania africana (strain ATCC 22294 / BCRC 22015 / CBS 2517 / CECT 1963 / NBRC 1671 / NRRL Y-8276) TaxID=1071382 RepID=H2AS19_KAZAF|nr:hypothetical protein KAFR_0C01760 [Kazachstania africana CBS 2517]CCF57169.1 hypothetical protein KAFR_0C01760 [Kazachstania africana CBS 2517]